MEITSPDGYGLHGTKATVKNDPLVSKRMHQTNGYLPKVAEAKVRRVAQVNPANRGQAFLGSIHNFQLGKGLRNLIDCL